MSRRIPRLLAFYMRHARLVDETLAALAFLFLVAFLIFLPEILA